MVASYVRRGNEGQSKFQQWTFRDRCDREEFKLECRQLKQNTTAQHYASAVSGREVLDPTPIESAALAIAECHWICFEQRSKINASMAFDVDDNSIERMVTTTVNDDNAVRWKHMPAQPLTTSGLTIL